MPTHVSLRRSPRCTRDGHLGRGRHSGESEWIEANCDSVVISTSYIPRLSSQDLSHRRLPQTRYISRAAPVQVCKPVADGGTSLHRAPSLLTSGMADVKYGLWTCELQMKHESSPGAHHQVSCCSSTYTRSHTRILDFSSDLHFRFGCNRTGVHCDATSLDTCLVTTIHHCITLRP